MSDDDIGFDTAFLTLPPFSFTVPIPPFSTRDPDVSPTFLSEPPTDFSVSAPPLSTSLDISLSSTLTLTEDPTITDAFPSSTGTTDTPPLSVGDPTSPTPTPTPTDTSTPATLPTGFSSVSASNSFLDSSITIDSLTSFPLSMSTSLSDSLTLTPISSTDSFSTFSPTSSDSSFTTDPSASDPSFTTSDSSLTSSSPSPTSSSPISTSSSPISTSSDSSSPSPTPSSSVPVSSDPSSTTTPSQASPTTSFPPPVTTASFPTFGPDPRPSSGRTGVIVAAATGAIAFVIVVALLAILCRKRYLKSVRRRAALEPFLDLDGEMVAVNQPLIIGDSHGPGEAVYSDPFTDDVQPRTQTRTLSVTTGIGSAAGESHTSSQAVVGTNPTHTSEPRDGLAAEHHNQRQPTDQLLPPSQPPPPMGITRSRSPQSLPPVQTQFQPQFPVPRPSSPPLDPGAVAYLRYADRTTDRGPPSPGHHFPGYAEDQRLTSAFSVALELSPQYSIHAPPPAIDEKLRNSPDPIQAFSAFRHSFNRRQSFTPTVSGPGYEPGDTAVITPLDPPPQGPTQSPISPGSVYSSTPQTIRGSDFASRPSPIAEITEMLAHSKYASDDSATGVSTRTVDTSMSLPVVMTAEKFHVTPGSMSIPLTTPTYTASPGLPTDSSYGESLPLTGATNEFPRLPPPPDGPPPLPPVLQIQPLSLGKKRSAQGPS